MAYQYQENPPKYKKLYLDEKNSDVYGVCAGIADYTGIDVGLVRTIAVLGFIFTAAVVVGTAYLILAWLLDPKPDDLFETKEEDEFWKDVRTKPKSTIRDVRHKFREIERRLRRAEAHVTSKEYSLKREIDDLKDKK
jgi:phage shock protein C